MVKESSAELVVSENAELAESPVWDPRFDRLIWADIAKGIAWRSDVATGQSEMCDLKQPVGCIAPCGPRGYVMGGGPDFFAMDSFGATASTIASAFDDHRMKMNDGAIDEHGRFWAGSTCLGDNKGIAALYCLDHDGSVNTAFGDVTSSNGFDWSPDGRKFYYVDTAAGGIDVFDVDGDSGMFTNRRRFVDIPLSDGLADGLTIDIDDCVWLAIWYLGTVRRYDPKGKLMEIIAVPTSLTTSCTFGGNDMRTLFITTAKGTPKPGIPLGELAGSIFAIETNTAGQVRPEYPEPIRKSGAVS